MGMIHLPCRTGGNAEEGPDAHLVVSMSSTCIVLSLASSQHRAGILSEATDLTWTRAASKMLPVFSIFPPGAQASRPDKQNRRLDLRIELSRLH